MCWGLRNMKKYQLTSVTSPSIDFEIGDHKITSTVIKNLKRNPNFDQPLFFFDVVSMTYSDSLILQSHYHPVLPLLTVMINLYSQTWEMRQIMSTYISTRAILILPYCMFFIEIPISVCSAKCQWVKCPVTRERCKPASIFARKTWMIL